MMLIILLPTLVACFAVTSALKIESQTEKLTLLSVFSDCLFCTDCT